MKDDTGRRIVQELIMQTNGLTRADAVMVTDMVDHIIKEMMVKLDTLTQAAPPHIYAHVTTLSALMLERHLHHVNGKVEVVLDELAKQMRNM